MGFGPDMTRPRPFTPDARALGLAFTSALQADWDVDATAARIVAVAGPGAIHIALERLRHHGSRGPSEAARRAEQALVRALGIHEQVEVPHVAP